jgi:hypothetical protein
VWLEPPDGVATPYGMEGWKWRLRKSLYGLRQSPRKWNIRLHMFFTNLGFKRLESDYGLYVRFVDGFLEIITVYVDDLLIAAKKIDKIQEIKDAFLSEFEMVDFGEAQTILGIDILRDWQRKTLFLHQTNYVDGLLQKFKQQRTGYAASPLACDEKPLTLADCPSSQSAIAEMQEVPYREAIGSLMHIMVCTRPDIACAVGILSRYLQNPGPRHWGAAMRVIKYLHKTRSVGLCYRQLTPTPHMIGDLHGYCDSNWAGDRDSLCSTAGWTFIMNGAAIS